MSILFYAYKMLVFVDEAGDPGFSFHKNSSKFFSIGLVIFENSEEAIACDQGIESLKKALGKERGFEFHFRGNSDKIKESFLTTVSSYRFFYYGIIIDKSLIENNHLRTKNSFYTHAANLVFESAKEKLKNATVIFDTHGSAEFERSFQKYLKNKFNDTGVTRIRKIKMQKSHSNNLLQLVDYIVSGVHHRHCKPHKYSFMNLIAHKEIKVQVWP